MRQSPSPNFNERALPLQYIVVHGTGMQDAASAFLRLCDPLAEVSAHYVIDEDGSISQLVNEDKRAWHAGKSFWRGVTDMNSASIGIELVNPGHEFGYRSFPSIQITSLKDLLHGILERHKLSPTNSLVAHSDIAVTRKTDPGELFPWRELAENGLGVWPSPTNYESATEEEIAMCLRKIGYDITNLNETILAFQRRFHPENLTGIPNNETVARLRSVAELS